MNYMVVEPRFLWLLLLAPLPFLVPTLRRASFPALDAVPKDLSSSLLGFAIKAAAAVAIMAAAIALARPYKLAQSVKLMAAGAHVVVVIDRSLSMDFTMNDDEVASNAESKTHMAVRLLKDFVARAQHDEFGVVAFSTAPVFVLPISGHHAAVQAALTAMLQPGIPGTNVGLGLELALRMIAQDPHATSPAILFVSDGEYGGAGFFSIDLQESLRIAFRNEDTHLYWLFLRPHKGNEDVLAAPPPGQEDSPNTKPERYIDLFFKSLGVTYRIFWADSPRAIQDAVAEINRLETRPVTYFEQIPRKDVTKTAYAIAAFASFLLVAAKLAETGFAHASQARRWMASS